MADTLSWGKPKIEICAYVNDAMPASPVWIVVDTPVEDSTKLTPTKGAKQEAKQEGGGVIAAKYAKNSYSVEFELYSKKGKAKPIVDNDGVVADHYAFRLTPEDDTLEGFIIDKASVQVEDTFSAKDGKKWKYTFDALEPATGNILKPYTKA